MLAGSGGGDGDHGTSTRFLGSLLSFMQECTDDVRFMLTSNDISKLPPELMRSERVDAVVFCDLQSEEHTRSIWDIYLKYYELTDTDIPTDAKYTGADIKAVCRMAYLQGLSLREAAGFVVPQTITFAERLNAMRSFASGRCLSAEYKGVYRMPNEQAAVAMANASTSRTRKMLNGKN